MMQVDLETNHGTFPLLDESATTIGQVLRKFGIPLSAVWTYDNVAIASAETGRAALRQALFRSGVEEQRLAGRFKARVTRNINVPGLLSLASTSVRPVPQPATEWIFPSAEDGAYGRVYAQLSAEECLRFAAACVGDVLAEWPTHIERRAVVGVSGGGDSNVMMTALVESNFFQEGMLTPVMMLGIPDWDKQLDNAIELSESLGIDLNVLRPADTARMAGIKSVEHTISEFQTRFPDSDLEFLGTWLLRRVLSTVARNRNAEVIATGVNREDVFAEQISRIALGLPPLPAPFRQIGDLTLMLPIWNVPKKIADGAFPTYSLENYEARAPSLSPGRSAFYYLAYWVAEVLPGMDVTLSQGLAALAKRESAPHVEWDAELEDYRCRLGVEQEPLARWKAFLAAVEIHRGP